LEYLIDSFLNIIDLLKGPKKKERKKEKNRLKWRIHKCKHGNLLKDQTIRAIELAFNKETLEIRVYTDASDIGKREFMLRSTNKE
jgi:hypothetical protein